MKRKALITAVVVCLAAILAFGTLAVFTGNDAVTNKFMIAEYDPNNPVTPDELFSIDVYETDENGDKTDIGKTYDGIQPGDVLDKDPTIKNTGRYDQYARVHVTVTNAANWQKVCAANGITDLTAIFGGFDGTKWTRVDAPVEDTEKDTLTYTFYYNGVLKPGETATLFKTVTIPMSIDNAQMAALEYFEISIAADAIQSANTGDNAVSAFANYWGK